MSKIDELLKELCPDGVDNVSLDSILEYEQPSKYIVKSTEYNDLYSIPVLTAGKSFLLGYTDETSGVYEASSAKPTIIFDDFTTSFHWVDFPCKVKSSALKFIRPKNKDNVSFRYVYYQMSIIKFVAQEHIRHWISVYSKFEIPLPPLPIQQHIVEVLDTFTDAISNLEEELALREKQFEYYREQLLAFDDESSLGGKLFSGKVEWKELQDVSSIVRGASPRPIKNFLSEKSEGIPWIKIGDADPNDKYIVSTAEFINKQGASKSRFLKKGSFILSNSMSFGRPYILAIDGCIHDGWIAISDYERQINADYLYYVLKTANVKKYWSMSANNGAVSNLNADIVRGTVIPIPSLCAQQDIVEILNTFEAMIVNIKEEIVLRTKQYEYYREKLLSFGK